MSGQSMSALDNGPDQAEKDGTSTSAYEMRTQLLVDAARRRELLLRFLYMAPWVVVFAVASWSGSFRNLGEPVVVGAVILAISALYWNAMSSFRQSRRMAEDRQQRFLNQRQAGDVVIDRVRERLVHIDSLLEQRERRRAGHSWSCRHSLKSSCLRR